MGATIAGIAIATIISAISGYMGAQAQAEAYEAIASATEEEKKNLQAEYDKAYGTGSFNQQMQSIGLQSAKDMQDLIGNEEAWNKYVSGEKAWQDVPDFTFTEEDLYSDPSYQFRLEEGLKALEQSLVAGGNADSGYAQKAINDYAQKTAAQEYANAYNRAYTNYTNEKNFDFNAWKTEASQYYQNLQQQLSGMQALGSMGQQANTNQTNALMALAGQKANAGIQAATAQAAAGQANTSAYTSGLDALAKGINTGAGVYMAYDMKNPSVTNTSSSTNIPLNATMSGGDQYDDYVKSLIGSTDPNANSSSFAEMFLNGWNTSMPTTSNLTQGA